MKYFVITFIILGIIATPAISELTPTDFENISEILKIYADSTRDQINLVLVILIVIIGLLIIGIYLPNIVDIYRTRKEYDYKKLENRIQTLEHDTDKDK